MVGASEVQEWQPEPETTGGPAPTFSESLCGTYDDCWAHKSSELVADCVPAVDFLDMCSWDDALSVNSPSHCGAPEEQDLQVDDANEMDSAHPRRERLNTVACKRGGQKRSADTNAEQSGR